MNFSWIFFHADSENVCLVKVFKLVNLRLPGGFRPVLTRKSSPMKTIFVSDFQWSSFHLGRELQFGMVSSHPLCFLQDFYTFRLIFNKLATISYGSHNNFVAFCDGLRVSIYLSRLLPILRSHTNSYICIDSHSHSSLSGFLEISMGIDVRMGFTKASRMPCWKLLALFIACTSNDL